MWRMNAAPSTVTVRALETDAEIDTFYRLAIEAFSDAEDIEGAARSYRLAHETGPDFHAGQRRGAFLGATLVGGYLMLERWLLMDPARIRTACIGSVVTHPAHRGQGIGTAMMHDAEAHARYRGHALLLLNGIPDFYTRFGYVDIFDLARHAIRRHALPQADDLPPVRCATPDDAAALLALYRRHYYPYRGSFVRTLDHQRHHLRFQADRGIAPLVVEAPDGSIPGYLQPSPGTDAAHAREVAAESWEAALALLHAHRAVANDPPELWWNLPPDSPTLLSLADNLRTAGTTPRTVLSFPVRTAVNIDPHAGWMARPGHLSLLFHQLAPLWGQCWGLRGVPRQITFTLVVGGEPYTLTLHGSVVQVSEEGKGTEMVASLDPGVFTRLIFGYRSVRWAASQPDVRIPDTLLEPLSILFPPGGTWIPGSDVF
jgi:predicted N-acetyltransferase YhbS